MKVLMLVSDAYGGHGGIAFYNRCLAEALAQMPEVTEVVVVPRVTRFAPSDVPPSIRFLSAAAGSKLRYVACVMQLAFERFALVICGHINLLSLAVPFSRLKSAPLVLLAFGIDVWEAPERSSRAMVRRVNAIWAISKITRDRMNAWVGLPVSRYSVIPPAISVEDFGMAARRPDLVERYGLSGKKVILTLARLSSLERYKGIDEILECLPSLIAAEPSLAYVIAGDGDDQPRLQEKARALGLGSAVIFTGFIEESQKADYLRLADVFALPGRGEGFGIVLLEALACGVPVVGSLADGSREALLDGKLGELANPNNPRSIFGCVTRAFARGRGVPAALDYFGSSRFRERVSMHARPLLKLVSSPD